MKNISLAINAILVVAVVVLYYWHFSGSTSQSTYGPTSTKDLRVAYINSDTVLKYYEYVKVNTDRLDAKGKRLEQDLQNRAVSLQNEIESYQRNASGLTIGQARAVEEDLGKKRQNLEMYQQSLSQELMVEQDKLTKDLYTRITSHLKKYGQERGLQFVLKFNASSDLLYAGDSLNISKEVIAGLNESYRKEITEGTTKKDTTSNKKK